MAQFRKKPVVIEAINFDELVQFGKDNGGNIVNDMPWSFTYKGQAITHENDKCYLIPTLEGTMKFTPDDMLITGVTGEIYPCKKEIFDATYEPCGVRDWEEDFAHENGKYLNKCTQCKEMFMGHKRRTRCKICG